MRAVANISFPESHPALPGHFPGTPIVPGVLLLDSVIDIVERDLACAVTEIVWAKFHRPVFPRSQCARERRTRCEGWDDLVRVRDRRRAGGRGAPAPGPEVDAVVRERSPARRRHLSSPLVAMSQTPRSSWVEQPERGSPTLLRLLVWLTLTFGRPLGRLLLLPIALYFSVFSRAGPAASREYLPAVLGRRARFGDVYRHYLTFSRTILDRVFFLTDRFGEFDVEIVGADHMEALLREGQGCVLLGGHLGSFEALRTLGTDERKVPVKALYNAHNTDRLDALFQSLNPAITEHLILMRSWASMIEAKEFIEQGGMVGILGDRSLPDGPTIDAEFLGRPAGFPAWPARLALAIKAPVILFFAIYMGGRKYRVFFEPFIEAGALDELDRDTAARHFVERYAGRLEHYCRLAPYNWFNFYAFWDTAHGSD